VGSSRHLGGSLGSQQALRRQHTKLPQPQGGLLHLQGMTVLQWLLVDSQEAVAAAPVSSQMPAASVQSKVVPMGNQTRMCQPPQQG